MFKPYFIVIFIRLSTSELSLESFFKSIFTFSQVCRESSYTFHVYLLHKSLILEMFLPSGAFYNARTGWWPGTAFPDSNQLSQIGSFIIYYKPFTDPDLMLEDVNKPRQAAGRGPVTPFSHLSLLIVLWLNLWTKKISTHCNRGTVIDTCTWMNPFHAYFIVKIIAVQRSQES